MHQRAKATENIRKVKTKQTSQFYPIPKPYRNFLERSKREREKEREREREREREGEPESPFSPQKYSAPFY